MSDATEILANSNRFNVAEVTVETQLLVERFLHQQAEYLDEKQWEKWLSLFLNDGHYWMPAEENQTEGAGVPNIFWENMNMMRMRIQRNEHPQAHSQAPNNRLCHVVSNVIIESQDENGNIIVRSRFHCAEYFRYDVRNFTGKYRHYLEKTNDGYKIKLQRTDLVNREGPYEYVLQWWL
jgi:3-phenylpropionate/cinnamic acid dioxygenase small subunit